MPRTTTRGAAPAPSAGATGTIWPRVLTVRAVVLFVVLLLAFVMLLPTVRGFLGQRSNLQAMRADLVAAEEHQEELEFQLGRWQDESYVASQARERLAYVFPGETAFRVLDPESVHPATNPDNGKVVEDGLVDVGGTDLPWYATIWNSVGIADEVAPSTGEKGQGEKDAGEKGTANKDSADKDAGSKGAGSKDAAPKDKDAGAKPPAEDAEVEPTKP